MQVTVKGNKLVIEMDLQAPTPSSSGKTLVIAKTGGFAGTTATIKHDGKDKMVKLNVTATIEK